MNVTAIIPAAGTGRRMERGEKKPYLLLGGRPLLACVLSVLDAVAEIRTIIIAVYPGEEQRCGRDVVEPAGIRTPVHIIAGGAQRQDSVRNALAAIPEQCDTVLVHDAARPLITHALVTAAIGAAQAHRATTMAVPVKDTIAVVDPASGALEQTPPRARLYSIQTPQTFAKDLLLRAHQAAVADGFAGTDDASLVARLGIPVTMLPGSYRNIKITTQEDLLIADSLLHREAS